MVKISSKMPWANYKYLNPLSNYVPLNMNVLSVSDLFKDNYIRTRENANKLFTLTEEGTTIDFSSVRLISLSFAQQFNYNLKKSKKSLKVINTNQEVSFVLRACKNKPAVRFSKPIMLNL